MVFTLPGICPKEAAHLRKRVVGENGELLLVIHPWPLGHGKADQDYTWGEIVKRAELHEVTPPDRPSMLESHAEFEQRLLGFVRACTTPVGVLFDSRERLEPSLERLQAEQSVDRDWIKVETLWMRGTPSRDPYFRWINDFFRRFGVRRISVIGAYYGHDERGRSVCIPGISYHCISDVLYYLGTLEAEINVVREATYCEEVRRF